jgi:hypothetical protein
MEEKNAISKQDSVNILKEVLDILELDKPDSEKNKTVLNLVNHYLDENKIYKTIKKKKKISPENAVVIVEKMLDVLGIDEFEEDRVETVAGLVESGRLSLKDGVIQYTLARAIKVHDGKGQRTFPLSEPDDQKLDSAGVDIFKFGQELASGKELAGKDVKGIARLTLGIEEDFAHKIPTKDIMVVFSLYNLFFLGQ